MKMMSFSQSQTQDSQKLGSLPYTENIPETKFENKIRIELDDNDYFLKGFLIGYRREKDRIKEWRAKKEEKKKKEFDASSDGEWRRVISDMIAKEVNSKLEEMKLNIESINNDRMKLKYEIDELKTKLEENKDEKSIEKLNWNEPKQESKIENPVEELRVKEEKVEVKEDEEDEEEEEVETREEEEKMEVKEDEENEKEE